MLPALSGTSSRDSSLDPQHDRVAAEIERQREGAAAARRGRQRREPARIRLQRDMPAVIHPRRVGDADLAEHLRCEVQQRERLVIAFDVQLGPVAHRIASVARLCILRCGTARARRMRPTGHSRPKFAAARRPCGRSMRCACALLGKSGEITAQLKSLGSMDPDTRAAEAPKIHALREAGHRRDRRAQGGARSGRAGAPARDRDDRPVAAGAGKRQRARSTRSAR